MEHLLPIQIGELLAEALEITESVFVNEAHQAEEFEQGVLQWCGGEQQLGRVRERPFQRVGDDVGGFVDVAQPVRFVDDHQVPRYGFYVGRFAPRELVGADDYSVDLEGAEPALLDGFVIGLRFEDAAGQEEFLREFLMPLLAQVGRRDHQHAALAFGPVLREHQARLNGFAEAHLVGEDRALRKRRSEREERRFDLMRVEVHLRIYQRPRELFRTVGGTALGEFVGEEFRVVWG